MKDKHLVIGEYYIATTGGTEYVIRLSKIHRTDYYTSDRWKTSGMGKWETTSGGFKKIIRLATSDEILHGYIKIDSVVDVNRSYPKTPKESFKPSKTLKKSDLITLIMLGQTDGFVTNNGADRELANKIYEKYMKNK